MTNYPFHLITDWRIAAPIEPVWELITHPDYWPRWWRAVKSVECLEEGDARGVGAYHRMRWRTALRYQIAFNMRTTRIVELSEIEGHADGELTGRGLWQFSSNGMETHVRYLWSVDVAKPWMRLLLPIARPLFRWNHGIVMQWGYEDLTARIGESG